MQVDSLRPEYTFEEFCALPMQLSMHISGDREHYLHRYNPSTGVNKVVITPVKKNGEFGKPVCFYYLPDDKRTFHAADQVYVAYMEYVCGVKPCCSPYCECDAGACAHPNHYDDRDRR